MFQCFTTTKKGSKLSGLQTFDNAPGAGTGSMRNASAPSCPSFPPPQVPRQPYMQIYAVVAKRTHHTRQSRILMRTKSSQACRNCAAAFAFKHAVVIPFHAIKARTAFNSGRRMTYRLESATDVLCPWASMIKKRYALGAAVNIRQSP